MSIDNTDFESITESDIEELITGQVSEGLHIEYKQELYGSSDSNKKEALKDISAFANSHGGHLILGMAEKNGLPDSLTGLVNINPDSEILRLEQMSRTGIEPRIPGIKIRAIPLSNGTHSIVVRIPTSWNSPHRVSFQGSNKIWIRNSAGVHEANIEELGNLFTLSTSAFEKIQNFRVERLKAITDGLTPRPLQQGGRLILHIIPLSAFIFK